MVNITTSTNFGASDSETTVENVTPDKSSDSRSYSTLSSEGSSCGTEPSQNPFDQSSVLTGPQTLRKDKGEVTGVNTSKDMVTQSGGDRPFCRYGDTPPPCTFTRPPLDQVRHKPESQDLEQRSLMGSPYSESGAHAHPTL